MTTDTEIIEGEVVEPRLLPAIMPTVALPVSVDDAIKQWDEYQELTRRLLNDTDYQKIGQGQFKKKSAWRKYAKAFNISDHVTHEEIVRDATGFPIFARVRVEAYHEATGRRSEADHECHVTERCCPNAQGAFCRMADWKNHTCCTETCTGKVHFSHPGDLPATALTRAKNRAISDLIGAGEVSAEEMEGRPVEKPAPKGGVKRPERNGKPMPPPNCAGTDHGRCKFVPAGTSKATEKFPNGKPYESFWICQFPDCKAGYQGRKWSIKVADWDSKLSQMEAEGTPRPDVDYGDLPSE